MKYSKQREGIMEAMRNDLNHPTADTIYNHVRQGQPSISLGTVYRNLNQLVESGMLRRISTPENGDRFDIRTDPHPHMICTHCGMVRDVAADVFEHLDHDLLESEGFHVEDRHIIISGTCRECMAKMQDEKAG